MDSCGESNGTWAWHFIPVVLLSLCVACSILAWYAAACAGMLRSWLMVSDSQAHGASFAALVDVTSSPGPGHVTSSSAVLTPVPDRHGSCVPHTKCAQPMHHDRYH